MYGQERVEEHGLFLRWLLDLIRTERVEGLIIAGDIFDSASPPQSALRQYYDFLRELIALQCPALIIGGNHDSGQVLNAPRDLLRALGHIHVHGIAAEDNREALIPWPDTQAPEVLLCACPYLRDGDLRRSGAAETQSDVREKLKAGLIQHYADLLEASKGYREAGVPTIATGHLTLNGTSSGEGEREIHLGAGGLVTGQDLGASHLDFQGFDYIALGHIHRAQVLHNKEHVRYSGSPVPLSFSEAEDVKEVVLLETRRADPHRGTPSSVTAQSIAVPNWRRLVRWEGTLDEVCAAIQAFESNADQTLDPWADLKIQSDLAPQIIDAKLLEALKGKNLRVLRMRKIETVQRNTEPAFAESRADLHELNPRDVFAQKCADEGHAMNTELGARLHSTFAELLEMHQQQVAAR